MLNFSYTLLATLNKELENIENTRKKILLKRVSPKNEIFLKFEIKAKIISNALKLSGKTITSQDVLAIIEGNRIKNDMLEDGLSYKAGLDYIKRNWILSDENINADAVYEIVKLQKASTRIKKGQIEEIVNFILVNPEHPIVQAALILILMYDLLSSSKDALKISTSVSRLFLYKYGYDFREMLDLEEFIAQDLDNFEQIIKRGIRSGNVSQYLDYFVQAIAIQSEKVLEKIEAGKKRKTGKTFADLTERQKQILSMFEVPGIKITNRSIQKEFNVSQITASRDLAKLVALQLVFPNGRGRSVYYIKL